MQMELLVHQVYRGIWRAAEPLVTWYIRRKDLRRGVLPAVTSERFGSSNVPGMSHYLSTTATLGFEKLTRMCIFGWCCSLSGMAAACTRRVFHALDPRRVGGRVPLCAATA